jgi:hypothetical protein
MPQASHFRHNAFRCFPPAMCSDKAISATIYGTGIELLETYRLKSGTQVANTPLIGVRPLRVCEFRRVIPMRARQSDVPGRQSSANQRLCSEEKFRLRGCSLWLPADVPPCSRICTATPHAQVTGRARNSFAIDLKAESQPTLSRTDERLEKRNRSTLARQARAIRDIFASD